MSLFKKKYPTITILIPCHNCEEVLEETVESLRQIDYDLKNTLTIFVDFNSTDNTPHIIQKYLGEQVGVYTVDKPFDRTARAEAIRASRFALLTQHYFTLWPGDTIYPDYFKKAHKLLKRLDSDTLFVANVDIQTADGTVHQQKPIFDRACHIRSFSKDSIEFLRNGYKHMVSTFGPIGYSNKDKTHSQRNQQDWWNQLAFEGLHRDVVYCPEPLACRRSPEYPHELDEIVYRFESGITCSRMAQDSPERFVMKGDFGASFNSQLANYTLWRAFRLVSKGLDKQAEDLFIFSAVIDPQIKDKNMYQLTERWLETRQDEDRNNLQDFHDQADTTLKPKWPLHSSWLRFNVQQVLKRFDPRSSFGKG